MAPEHLEQKSNPMNIVEPRKIINRKALLTELDELVSWSGYTPKTQPKVLSIFKTAHTNGWNEVKRRFEEEALPAREVLPTHAFLIDQLVRTIYEFAITRAYPSANPTAGEQMSVVATGGYGRGELAPYSDIDLMFLLPYKLTAHSEQVIEFVLYTLWDLGLKVGHATRSIEDTVRLSLDDLTIRTSLLEARWIWGNKPLFAEFKQKFNDDVIANTGPSFVDGKLEERDTRHDRMGDTRYVLEPNIKEGKGGLRDLQTLFWIAKYLYQVEAVSQLREKGVLTTKDTNLFTKAENFLWTVRCHLHYLVGRPEERLTFDVQSEIATKMGYTDHKGNRGVERFMKHYFLIAKDVGDITRIICSVLEEQQKKQILPAWLSGLRFRRLKSKGFQIDGGRLNLESDQELTNDPLKFLQLFELAQKEELDIHPQALRLVKQKLRLINSQLRNDAQANQVFLNILTGVKPEKTLMRLNEAGVMGRFIPDFGRVVAQMQYDMYHVYTVDEHTIRAIGVLNGIETGKLKEDHPVSWSVIGEVQSRRVLYLAVLLHDIAKGRGGDHSVLGAKVCEKLGPRLGLSDWETETIAWLVRHHLVMSNTAFKRDIDDEKTVSDFVDTVQSPERLRLLLILTVADIRAVGPNVWNGWKAGLLRELYWRAQESLSGSGEAGRAAERVEKAKRDVRHALSDWGADELDQHMSIGHSGYWLSQDTHSLVEQAKMIKHAAENSENLKIETRTLDKWTVTEIVIYAPDHPGLFASIAGAIALSGHSVVDAKVQTLNNGMVIDTFWLQTQSGEPITANPRLESLKKRIADAIQGTIRPAKELQKASKNSLPSRTRVFKVPPRVLIDNKASKSHTVVEINGRDRPGLLHDITAAISHDGLQISSAHISTYGERVVDVFYIKDIFGLKVDTDQKIKRLHKSIMTVIDEPKPAAKPKKQNGSSKSKSAGPKPQPKKGKPKTASPSTVS